MDFKKRMGNITENSVFKMDGFFVWCGTIAKGADGKYYLYFSFWPKGGDFNHDWVICSKIGYAVSDNPYGGFEYCGIALDSGTGWDSGCVHNPAIIRHNGKYYMYYMGNHGNGEYWEHRNNQRIGVAISDKSWMLSTPKTTIIRKSNKIDIPQIINLYNEYLEKINNIWRSL